MKNTKTVKLSFMLNEEQKVEPTSENGNSTKPPVICLICPSCGSSDKYVEFYNEDMICQGCGYDLGRILSNVLRLNEVAD